MEQWVDELQQEHELGRRTANAFKRYLRDQGKTSREDAQAHAREILQGQGENPLGNISNRNKEHILNSLESNLNEQRNQDFWQQHFDEQRQADQRQEQQREQQQEEHEQEERDWRTRILGAVRGPQGDQQVSSFPAWVAVVVWVIDGIFQYIGAIRLNFVWTDIIRISWSSVLLAFLVYFIINNNSGGQLNIPKLITQIAATILIIFVIMSGALTAIGVLHLVFILWFWFTYVNDPESSGAKNNLMLIGVIIFDFYRYPLLVDVFGLPLTIVRVIMVFPFLLFWTVLFLMSKYPGSHNIKKLFWTIFFIVLFFNWQNLYTASQSIIGTEEGIGVKSPIEVIEGTLTGFEDFLGDMRTAYDRQLEFATGGYYKSKVEKNQDPRSKLGVYIEDLEVADKHFLETEPTIIWGDLSARTLDEPIIVSMSCETGPAGKVEQGTIKPVSLTSDYTINQFEEIGFECRFEPGILKVGSNKVRINAEFTFETLSFLKTYFMDIDQIRALRKDNIDPLKQYGIKENDKRSISTYGPVRLGLGSAAPPIGLSTSDDGFSYIGVTLENFWTHGRIKEIKDIQIRVPKELQVASEYGAGEFCSGGYFEAGEVEDDYQVFSITEPGINVVKTPITTFKSWRCSVEIPTSKVKEVLGDTPVATYFYRASASYVYEIQQEKEVFVRSDPGQRTYLSSCTTECKDADGCICNADGCGVDKGSKISRGATCNLNAEGSNKLFSATDRVQQIRQRNGNILLLIGINDRCLVQDNVNLDEIQESLTQEQASALSTCRSDPFNFFRASQDLMIQQSEQIKVHISKLKEDTTWLAVDDNVETTNDWIDRSSINIDKAIANLQKVDNATIDDQTNLVGGAGVNKLQTIKKEIEDLI